MRFHSTAVLVLGQALENNRNLSVSLIGRCNLAVRLLKHLNNGDDDIIVGDRNFVILSGGDVKKTGISEARAMNNFMIGKYSTICEVFLEEKSKNTVENAINCLPFLEEMNCGSIYLVTSEFHMPRAKCIFESVFKTYNINDTVLICHSSNSGMDIGSYRILSDRPTDVNRWRLCERLDIEQNALSSLNDYLVKYSITPVEDDRIEAALKELRVMNITRKSTIK